MGMSIEGVKASLIGAMGAVLVILTLVNLVGPVKTAIADANLTTSEAGVAALITLFMLMAGAIKVFDVF
jgi:hypothetical protein